jgi:exopolysaccharide biosynthesis polyprenyl glycosylphosphotransferase
VAVDVMPKQALASADSPAVSGRILPVERRAPSRLGGVRTGPDTFQRDALLRRALAASDVLATSLAMVIVLGPTAIEPAALGLPFLCVLITKVMGLHDRDQLVLRKRTLDQAPALFQLSTLLALVTWLAQDLTAAAPLGPQQVVSLWAFYFFGFLAWRTLARWVFRAHAPVERVLVVSECDADARLSEKLTMDPSLKAEVVAHLPLVDRRVPQRPLPHSALEAMVETHRINRVIVAPDGADHTTTLEVVARAKDMGVNVSLLPRICEVVGSSVEFDELGGMTLLGVRPFGLSRSSAAIKRAVDLAGAALGLFVVAPVMALIALAIRLDSPGPALFRQTRVGRDGDHFEILKFRTMVDGAHAQRAALAERSNGRGLFKVPDDPRVTRVGRFLRRTSLDELPQLWNVLRGDMSLVGPRPLILEEDGLVAAHYRRRRLHLKPGLTGPWQVLGSPNARVGVPEMASIDYLYVANWTLWADVQVVIRTVLYVLGGRGV